MATRKEILTGVGAAIGVLLLGFAVIFVLVVYQQRDLIRKRQADRMTTADSRVAELRRRRQAERNRATRRTQPAVDVEDAEPTFAQPQNDAPVYIPRAPIREEDPRPIRVGILHALSGPLSLRETALKDVALLTIDQLNRHGGVLGRTLEPVVMPTYSSWSDFADKAATLVEHEKVAVTFGCWASTARRAVLNVFERNQALLFYPRYYEGEESSASVFYTGGTPNQRAVPAARYLLSPEGGDFRRFILIGTDEVFARTNNRIVRYLLRQQGVLASDILELYAPQDITDFSALVEHMRFFVSRGPAAVLSSLEGDSNLFFYTELSRQKLSPAQLPVVALAVDENLIADLGHDAFVGQLIASNYVMSHPSLENDRFLTALRRWQALALANDEVKPEDAERSEPRPVPLLVADETMVATHESVRLWAQAVEQAGTTSTLAVRQALAGQYLAAPSGVVEEMDRRDHHLHKAVFISRVSFDGTLQVLYESKTALDPEPFSRLVPETARKVADWTYPFMCENCTEPRFPDVGGEIAGVPAVDNLWPLTR